ncbi:MAG: NADH-quinone oxidoreductase subunit K [Bacteriovoracia bacterium]
MDLTSVANKINVILLLAVFVAGLSAIALRRVAAWGLVGQATALKAVVACGFLFSQYFSSGGGDLIVLSLVALGMVPALVAVGLLVLHRCSRFRGTLDVDEEDSLRH